MQQSTIYKSKQFFTLVVKLFIVIGCGYFIYYKLFKNQQLQFDAFFSNSVKNELFSIKNITFLLILTAFNWFFEIKKWQVLVSYLKNISFFEAAKQSLASLTASLITPNRIGEYGAKALYFESGDRKQILALNLVGNLFQLLATIVFGIFGIIYFAFNFTLDKSLLNFMLVIGTLFIVLIIAALLLKKLSYKGYSLQTFIQYTKKTSKKSNLKVLILSFARYSIFLHQFYFMLLLFNVEIQYTEAIFSIFTMYLLASLIPMLSFFDVVVKSSAAILIFSYFNINEIAILSTVMLMWIFNFVIPSIAGSYFVLTFKSVKLS
ncbi:MAG: flippase-like domain-containing protein [Flavobacteriaceae bacterium]|nr:flippase-like domain-containing protein [Flavobacteriaceae bacterium]